METLSGATKRKKRKTRKCLDELRKRSRRNNLYSSTKIYSAAMPKLAEPINVFSVKQFSNYVTSSRVTLAMLPKAIRSETITRPALAELAHEPITAIERLKDDNNSLSGTVVSPCFEIKDTSNDSTYVINSEDDSIKDIFEGYGEMEEIVTKEMEEIVTNHSDTQNQDHSSNESFMLFSPREPSEDVTLVEESPVETTSIQTTPTSQSSRDGCQLYEEFMNEIPIFLREHTPNLIKENVMKKARSSLHSIYMESCRQECEKNILHCMKSNMLSGSNKSVLHKEPIVQSPMEYLKGSAWEPSPLPTSPDYIYFPHKLN